jgi:phosphoribosylanthranilate isomerase
LTRVKICGITKVSHAQAAIEAGADLIGVVFAPSPRQVIQEKAGEIVAEVKKHNRLAVGVFVNIPATEANAVAADCGLDWVQLSGDETWEYCRQIEKPVIKAIHISSEWDGKKLLAYLEEGQKKLGNRSPIYLLDTFAEQKYGGTGKVFTWEIARRAVADYPVIIAGGLHPGNAGEVVSDLRPWGVDVSSGVETKGVKDVAKIKAFIRAVRSADQGYG